MVIAVLRKSWVVLFGLLLAAGCGDEEARVVAIVVDQQIASGTASGRSQLTADLESDGYEVVELVVDQTDPAQIRAYLRGLYDSPGDPLVGAILMGDIPHAYQWVTFTPGNPAFPPLEEEVISYQYYNDLDGIFTASTGYQSPGSNPHSYDEHSGDVDWEIWIGVLPMLNGDPAQTIAAMNDYLGRNHNYRTTGPAQPRSLLFVTEHYQGSPPHQSYLASLQDGQYSWTPWSAASGAQIYFDYPPAPLTVDEGYVALTQGTADFFVGSAHGSSLGHGKIGLQWLADNPVATSFFWSNGCAVGNLDVAGNFLTAVLYDADGDVVLARGTTNNSGGMGMNQEGFFGHNVATRMEAGRNIGEAVLGHVNVPLVSPWKDSREFHYATSVMLGDPSLGLPPASIPPSP